MTIPHGWYFEDFTLDQSFTSPGRTITEADLVNFAGVTGDWTRLHTDAVYAAGTIFGQRVAHGTLVFSVAIGLALRSGILEETLLAFREVSGWKFSRPVFIGDTITVRGRVAETRPAPRLNGGLVTLAVEVVNQHGEVVQSGAWRALVKSRHATAPQEKPAGGAIPPSPVDREGGQVG